MSFSKLWGWLLLLQSAKAVNVLQYVNPLIGTQNGGNVFPGATLPFGMAKAVADVNGADQGGFATDGSNVTGFSHTHDSGTGGSPSLGNFPLFPQSGCVGDLVDGCVFPQSLRATPYVNSSVIAKPGYFAVTLTSKIKAEMTVTNHTALYRFTFPGTPVEPNAPLSPLILADLIDLPLSRSAGNISVDPTSGRITGSGTFSPSFGIGTYNQYFCADFQGASIRDTGVFKNNRAGSQPKSLNVQTDGVNNSPELLPAGAYVRFQKPSNPQNQILARVGVSFISTDRACQNAQNEISSFQFQSVQDAATAAWKQQLGAIQINPTGVNDTLLTTFYSGLYRANISPQDYTGENPLWQSSEPYYDSFYCIWDSFRDIHPLITIVDPDSQARMVRSLIDTYRHEGWLPDCRMSLCKGFTQGGSNADVVLADTYLKFRNLSSSSTDIKSIDWPTAYEAVVKDAEVQPPVWSVEGRGGLASWKSLGYIPTDDYDPTGSGPFTRSISRTVEYAYNDFCISEMSAGGLGSQGDTSKYIGRSFNFRNMYNPQTTSTLPNATSSTGFKGFLQPRYLNKTFGVQDPAFCSPLLNFTSCYLNPDGHETYEGSSWLYTFYAPHAMATLISQLGGSQQFVKRLDFLHESGLLYIGDEQAFLTVYLYHYAGRPGRSSYRAHTYIPSSFNDTFAGIPGNDDSGAMGSFSTLAMMGLWPVSGQNVYLLAAPFFQSVSIKNRVTGKTATVRVTKGFDPSYKQIYIQSATLNGKPYSRNWITHDFFALGQTLELVLGSTEGTWGTATADLPPSVEAPSSNMRRDGLGWEVENDEFAGFVRIDT